MTGDFKLSATLRGHEEDVSKQAGRPTGRQAICFQHLYRFPCQQWTLGIADELTV